MTERRRTRLKVDASPVSTSTDGLLNWSWVQYQATKSRNYWISTTRPDGSPHAVPIWCVWIEDVLYGGVFRQSVKGKNALRDPRVVMHLESGDEVVIFEGAVEPMMTDPAFVEQFRQAYTAKYDFTPNVTDEPENFYFRFVPRVTMAWLEKDFVNTATRWEIVTV